MLKWIAALVALGAAMVLDEFFAGIIVGAVVRWLLTSGASDPLPGSGDRRGAPLPPATVVVVGNIGAGKTTAIRNFEAERRPGVRCECEPVELWRPFLEAAESPGTAAQPNAAWLELQCIIAAFYANPKPVPGDDAAVVVTERDLASVALFSGSNPAIAAVLKAFAATGKMMLPTAVLYLSASWDVCMARVERGRNQAGDKMALAVGAQHFQRLQEKHEVLMRWYMKHGVAVVSVADADNATVGLIDLHEYAKSERAEKKSQNR